MAAVVLGRPAVPALDKAGEDEFAGGLLHADRLRSAQPDGKSRKEEEYGGHHQKNHHNSFLPSPAEGSPASSTELDLRPAELLQAKHYPPVPRLPLYLVQPDAIAAPSSCGRSGVLSSASSSSSSLSSSSVSSLPTSQLATPKQTKHADERWSSSARWQDDGGDTRTKLEADASLDSAKASLYDSPLWQRYGWIAVHLAMMLCQACFAAVNVFGKYGMYHVDPIIIVVFRNMGTRNSSFHHRSEKNRSLIYSPTFATSQERCPSCWLASFFWSGAKCASASLGQT